VQEIKHDGFRVVARKAGGRTAAPAINLTGRFTLIVQSLAPLPRAPASSSEAVSPKDELKRIELPRPVPTWMRGGPGTNRRIPLLARMT
jgi:hypothetical protein